MSIRNLIAFKILTLLNLLNRFKVTIDMIKPEKLDHATTLKGTSEYFDVPPASNRDYKINFFAHKEGSFGAKVIYLNILLQL